MRITQSLTQTLFLSALSTQESNLSQTRNQIATNSQFSTASQNPTAAGAVNNFNQTLSQSQQYDTNANSAQINLNTEDNALAQVQGQLQTLRSLALQANNGVMSTGNLSQIAAHVAEIQKGLVSLANTQNGNGEYLFSGYAVQTQPFTLSASGATYNGDQGQRQIQIGPGQSVIDGASGDAVFNQITTGNGTFSLSANPANTGGGIIGASSVTNPAAYDKGTYSINFTSPTTYDVRDSGNVLVTSGTYSDGQFIAFRGVQLTLNGAPATGDSFTLAASTKQSLFTTVQNLMTALQTVTSAPAGRTQLNNTIVGSIDNIDQAIANISNVRAGVGGRLNAITAQLAVSGSQQVQLKGSISSLKDLDYASAITSLQQQNTALSASLQSYSITQGLTLFKYL
jgi:flagellar hook-associated protein 3 FlgL